MGARALPKQMSQYFSVMGPLIAPISIKYGAAGAVSEVKGPFIVSASKTGTGQTTIVFDRALRGFMGSSGYFWKLAGATAALTVNSTAASQDAVGTGDTGHTMIIETKAGAVATDPADGDKLYFWPAWSEVQADGVL